MYGSFYLQRVKSGILAKYNYKNLDEQARKHVQSDIKCYGQQAKHTTVDSLFGGYLLSSVLCTVCEKVLRL